MQDPGSKKEKAGAFVFSREEYSDRVARTAKAVEKAGIDVLVAFANKVMPGYVRYLSGYETRHGIHDWCMFLLHPESGTCALLTNVSWESLSEVSWVKDIRLIGLDRAGAVLSDCIPKSARTIGIAGFNAFPAVIYQKLLNAFPQTKIEDASAAALEPRRLKSPAEIEVLRKCAQISDAGACAFLAGAREGRTEREILVEVETALKLNGSDEVSFTTQVGSGPRTSTICPYPTDRCLRPGDIAQVDCGATYLGYRGDISRVAMIGEPSELQRKMLDVTAEMYHAMLAALRPGATAAEIAAIGVNVGTSHGLGDLLYRSPNHDVGFMGHAMGCSYHEPPELNPETSTVLCENMLIVLEPILMCAGVGGVKIEDAVLVTSRGAERLSSCPIRTW
jgi:Xaa-Pro aminopeptidase